MILQFFRNLIVTGALVLCCLGAAAQFSDSTPHHIRYEITGILNKTNDARSYLVNNVLNFTIRKRDFSLNSSSSWAYGRSGANLTNNDFISGINLDYLKDVQKVYYWALSSYTTSFSLKINYQFQAGGGIGYNFVNRENFELVVSDGLLYETAGLEPKDQENDNYQTVRNSLRIKLRINFNDIVSLNGTHFWQPSLNSIDDYIIRSVSTCSVKLRKWLNISAGCEVVAVRGKFG